MHLSVKYINIGSYLDYSGPVYGKHWTQSVSFSQRPLGIQGCFCILCNEADSPVQAYLSCRSRSGARSRLPGGRSRRQTWWRRWGRRRWLAEGRCCCSVSPGARAPPRSRRGSRWSHTWDAKQANQSHPLTLLQHGSGFNFQTHNQGHAFKFQSPKHPRKCFFFLLFFFSAVIFIQLLALFCCWRKVKRIIPF